MADPSTPLIQHVRRTARWCAVVVLPCLTFTACYSTVPVSAPPPGRAEVILDMTPAATEQMSSFLGRGTVSVRGRLLEWQPDSIVISMLATELSQGDEQLWKGERVAVPRAAVARITERRIQRGRTGLLALASVAVIVTAIGVISNGIGGTSGGGTKPVPQ